MSELPNGWVDTKLNDLGHLYCGQSPSVGDVNRDGLGTPYVTGPEQWDGQSVHRTKWTTDPRRVVPDGCIFITVKGAGVGTMFPGIPCAIGRDVYAYQPHDAVDFHFVSYALQHTIAEVLQNARGDIPGLSRDHIVGHSIGVPPLYEQRRIVAKLDSLRARSSRARHELDHIPKLIERYKQAILAKAFSGELTADWRESNDGADQAWPIVSVSEIANVVTGSTPPTADKAKYFGGSVPFFKPTDLDAGYQVQLPRETLTEEGANRSRRVPAGATLVTCIGATIAKTGLARVDCCTNQQINALVPDLVKVLPEWLYWMVISPDFRSSIIANASATTLPIINKGRFEQLELPLPERSEQAEIVSRVEKAFLWLDKITAEHARAEHLLPKLDQAILAKAFRGDLVPQDPNDEPASVLLERIRSCSAVARPPRGRART